MTTVEQKYIEFPGIKFSQPMGDFYSCVLDWKNLRQISFVDMRTIERELDNYIGIQRKLSDSRVSRIGKFVNTVDAAFPTSIVLAVPGRCFSYDEEHKKITLREDLFPVGGVKPLKFHEMAKVLDGQHRIEGLAKYEQEDSFEIPVTLVVNADIADEAYIFATVNLAQTKVNKSLVYDLMDYERARSPQKTCHEIVVALNRHLTSPFYRMIKRLGSSTPGVKGETLAQATFVAALLPLISREPIIDRDLLLRGKRLPQMKPEEFKITPFRYLFIKEDDAVIAKNLAHFFSAVKDRWPHAWLSREKGNILPRTNGFNAFMRLFKDVYIHLVETKNSDLFDIDDYAGFISRIDIDDDGFTSETYIPGSSGETMLYEKISRDIGNIL